MLGELPDRSFAYAVGRADEDCYETSREGCGNARIGICDLRERDHGECVSRMGEDESCTGLCPKSSRASEQLGSCMLYTWHSVSAACVSKCMSVDVIEVLNGSCDRESETTMLEALAVVLRKHDSVCQPLRTSERSVSSREQCFSTLASEAPLVRLLPRLAEGRGIAASPRCCSRQSFAFDPWSRFSRSSVAESATQLFRVLAAGKAEPMS